MTLEQILVFGTEVIARVARALLEAGQGRISPEEALARIQEASKQDAAVDGRVDEVIGKRWADKSE